MKATIFVVMLGTASTSAPGAGGGGLGRGGIGEYPYSLKGSSYQGRGRAE